MEGLLCRALPETVRSIEDTLAAMGEPLRPGARGEDTGQQHPLPPPPAAQAALFAQLDANGEAVLAVA